MPRWYYLLVLRGMQLISIASLAIGGIIAVCIIADWVGRVGLGYPWYALPFLILVMLVALMVLRGTSAIIKRVPSK